MLRLTSAVLLLAISALPSSAQDRTLPAGSYHVLDAPYAAPDAADYGDYAAPALRQGRSDAIDQRAARRLER